MRPGPKKGYKQSTSHKEKRSKAVKGESNGRYKDGRRSYRTKAGAKTGDGTVVNHKDENRNNNSRSNLQVLNDKPKKGTKRSGRTTTPKHESIHKRASK